MGREDCGVESVLCRPLFICARSQLPVAHSITSQFAILFHSPAPFSLVNFNFLDFLHYIEHQQLRDLFLFTLRLHSRTSEGIRVHKKAGPLLTVIGNSSVRWWGAKTTFNYFAFATLFYDGLCVPTASLNLFTCAHWSGRKSKCVSRSLLLSAAFFLLLCVGWIEKLKVSRQINWSLTVRKTSTEIAVGHEGKMGMREEFLGSSLENYFYEIKTDLNKRSLDATIEAITIIIIIISNAAEHISLSLHSWSYTSR